MKTIKKMEVNYPTAQELMAKINELIEKINELNFEVAVIHEWKLQKEGI